MGEKSAIEWTDATFNPWWGCTRVSPGCDHCYADTWARRLGMNDLWDSAKRRTFGAKHWADPVKWNRAAERAGKRLRVFCASMADVFDKDGPELERANLWDLIEDTPHLDWLVLTKRIGNVKRMLPQPPENVWLGISVVNQEEADRDIPKLLEIPARVRFLSCEPLLGPISLAQEWLDAEYFGHSSDCDDDLCALNGDEYSCRGQIFEQPAIDWVIVGGESGKRARPMPLHWVTDIQQACMAAGVAFFMKQGSEANWPRFKEFESFPEDIRMRQWPCPASSIPGEHHGD